MLLRVEIKVNTEEGEGEGEGNVRSAPRIILRHCDRYATVATIRKRLEKRSDW